MNFLVLLLAPKSRGDPSSSLTRTSLDMISSHSINVFQISNFLSDF